MTRLVPPRHTGLGLHERTLVNGGLRVETLSNLSPEEATAFIKMITDRKQSDVVSQLIKDGFLSSENPGPQLREVRDWLKWHRAGNRDGLIGFLPDQADPATEFLALNVEGKMCGIVTCEFFPRIELGGGKNTSVLLRGTEVVTPQCVKNAKAYTEENNLPNGAINPRMLLSSSVTGLAQVRGAKLMVTEEIRSGTWCGARAKNLKSYLDRQGYRLPHGRVRVGNTTMDGVVPWIRPDDFPEDDYKGDHAEHALRERANNLYVRSLDGQRQFSGRELAELVEGLVMAMWPDSRYFTRADKGAAIEAMRSCIIPSEMYLLQRPAV